MNEMLSIGEIHARFQSERVLLEDPESTETLEVKTEAASVPVDNATASGMVSVSQIAVEKIESLGKELRNFPVLCHTLPPSATVDGLLGLDFLRGQRLILDFRTGTVTLE